jgi:ubiquinone/menaquinone biosynthesis C-methylase UbiE
MGDASEAARMGVSDGPKRWLFDVWSRFYDLEWVQRAVYRPEQDAVLDALRAERVRRVLDLGCGTGQLAHRLRSTDARVRVVGCDFSAGMLRAAAARDRRVAWVRGDALRLPFASAAFDAVVSTQAFHWFPDQTAALREIARVLRPGGAFVLTVVRPVLGPLGRLVEEGARVLRQPFHWPDGEELARGARQVGLRIEREERIFRLPGALLLPPVMTLARRTPARARRIA